MQPADFDKRSGANCTEINIAAFSGFAMFTNLLTGIGERNGLEFPLLGEGGGHNNIKLNPVFRGMPGTF